MAVDWDEQDMMTISDRTEHNRSREVVWVKKEVADQAVWKLEEKLAALNRKVTELESDIENLEHEVNALDPGMSG